MDVPHRHYVLLVLLFLEYLTGLVSASAWEHISLRYGTWYPPPRTPQDAERRGYRVVNKICKMGAYHGFLYIKGGNDKARFIFDHVGNLAGIQTAIPGNMHGFNALNETIEVPAREVIPPILDSDDRDAFGVKMYTITAYFKHPRLICSPYARNAHPGKGLYIQMGYNVEREFMRIPMEARHLDHHWKKGSCRPQMGMHYFRSLSPELPCEMLYPVFLMYNQDGLLGAFGWLFQGTPAYYPYEEELSWFKLDASIYPYTFDENMLPSCMFNPDFRVFGLRVYLRNKDSMICPIRTPAPLPAAANNNNNNHHNHHHNNNNPAPTTPTTPSPRGGPLRPWRTRTRHPARTPGGEGSFSTLKPPSLDDTLILDDIIRQRESAAPSTRHAAHVLRVLVTLLAGLHALLGPVLLLEEGGGVGVGGGGRRGRR
ncbi:uncharacterized protein LOC143286807 [Babylonia areolata]|uniref:uncharacterized protein LOC143286807 n=1 Tax=Babylonia areolata TaxID=304850 RepID=UPI003FD4FD0B